MRASGQYRVGISRGRIAMPVLALALVLAVPGVACGPSERPALPMCQLDVTADTRGDLALALRVANPGSLEETGRYTELLDAIELSVTTLNDAADDGATAGKPITISRVPHSERLPDSPDGSPRDSADAPPDGQAPLVLPRTETLTLQPRGGVRLVPKVRLRFASAEGLPASAGQPVDDVEPGHALWVIEHAPAPVAIQVVLTIDGMKPRQCKAEFDPSRQRSTH